MGRLRAININQSQEIKPKVQARNDRISINNRNDYAYNNEGIIKYIIIKLFILGRVLDSYIADMLNGNNNLVSDNYEIEIPRKKPTLEYRKFVMSELYCKKEKKYNRPSTNKTRSSSTNGNQIIQNTNAQEHEYPTCVVCLSEISKGSKTLMIKCGHMFHVPCIDQWLIKEHKCPTCRYQIKKKK